jgi:DNA polymerase I-like protein with 3'-5' exonuclease and polymerase domains
MVLICYSKGIRSIAEDLMVSVEKAQEIYDTVLLAFPNLKIYMENVHKFAINNGYVENFFGKRRHVPDLFLPDYSINILKGYENNFPNGIDKSIEDQIYFKLDKIKWFKEKNNYINSLKDKGIEVKENKWLIAKAERQLTNATVQSTAATLTKRAMVLIFNNKRLRELKVHIILSIHDEVQLSCPIEYAYEASKIAYNCMISSGKGLKATLKCDQEIAYCWYGEKLKFDDNNKLVTAGEYKKDKEELEYMEDEEDEDSE